MQIGFKGLVGGWTRVGQLMDMPKQDATQGFLLCDGTEISRAQFPELVAYLGGTETAMLPDYSGAVVNTVPTVTQTVDNSGTVTTGAPVDPGGDVGGTDGGNIPSGGRFFGEFNFLGVIP